MRRKMIGLLLMLLGSEAIGLLFGQFFFQLFRQTVPPAVLTDFNRSTAHAAFLLNGALLGLAILVWVLVVLGLARTTGWLGKLRSNPDTRP